MKNKTCPVCGGELNVEGIKEKPTDREVYSAFKRLRRYQKTETIVQGLICRYAISRPTVYRIYSKFRRKRKHSV